jgi:oxalate decarboxylase
LRELHWHPNADEWQYVIEGEFRVTLFGSQGRFRTETLAKGDVAYIPQGYGHSVENIGSNSGRLLIGLNTGNYQTIDLSQWISTTPSYLLAKVFGKSKAVFEKFPKGRAFICPPDGQGQREIK